MSRYYNLEALLDTFGERYILMKRKDNKHVCFMCQQLKVCEVMVKPKIAPTRYYCHSCISILHEIWRMRDREEKEKTTV